MVSRMLLFGLSQVGLAKELLSQLRVFAGHTYFEEAERTSTSAEPEPCGAARRTESSLGLKEQERNLWVRYKCETSQSL